MEGKKILVFFPPLVLVPTFSPLVTEMGAPGRRHAVGRLGNERRTHSGGSSMDDICRPTIRKGARAGENVRRRKQE